MSETGEDYMDDGFESANERYHNDATFHVRVMMAERATIRRLENEGMVLTAKSYRVAIRMAAMLGLIAAEVDIGGDNAGAR